MVTPWKWVLGRKLRKLVRYITIIQDGSSLEIGKMGTVDAKLVNLVTSLWYKMAATWKCVP
jgi:hypothetical protein